MKKIICLLLALCMSSSIICLPADAAVLNVGDYVVMGTYFDEPILWRYGSDMMNNYLRSDSFMCIKGIDTDDLKSYSFVSSVSLSASDSPCNRCSSDDSSRLFLMIDKNTPLEVNFDFGDGSADNPYGFYDNYGNYYANNDYYDDYTDYDDSPSDWAASEVDSAIANNLVPYRIRSSYHSYITREEFCEMVVQAYEALSGKTAQSGSVSFSDTSNDEILKAANLRIVNGYGNEIFAPNDLITREQIAAMVVRMISRAVTSVNVFDYSEHSYTDDYEISSWARPSINFAYENNIMQGVGNSQIAPQLNTTREEAILLVQRVFAKYRSFSLCDSLYRLDADHIARSEDTAAYYTNNMLLAYTKSGLSQSDKDAVAEVVGGTVAAELSGSVDLLQIKVETCTLDELNSLADKLSGNSNVLYASADILMPFDFISSMNTDINIFEGEDQWWYKAIGADKVWGEYGSFIKGISIGEIETNPIMPDHTEYSKRLSFVIPEQREYCSNPSTAPAADSEHATNVAGVMCAARDDSGMTGVASNSTLTFATMKDLNESSVSDSSSALDITDKSLVSSASAVFLVKKMVDAGVKVINCSFGINYYSEDYYNTHKSDMFADFSSYAEYLSARDLAVTKFNIATAIGTCQLIKNNNDFLVVQAAGNGINNGGFGIDVTDSGYWDGLTDEYNNIYSKFGLSYRDVKNHIIVVTAADNKKQGDNYVMSSYANYGSTIDICAPTNIKTTSAKGSARYNYDFYGTSAAAPVVSASAAVLWGIEPTLTAEQVKGRLIGASEVSAIDEDSHHAYPMLNLYNAAEALINSRKASVIVLDKATNQAVSGASISYRGDISTKSDVIGCCDLYMPVGVNSITVSKDGYKTQEVNIESSYIGSSEKDYSVKQIYLEKEKSDEQALIDAFLEKNSGNYANYLYFLTYDYDGDGALEAFVITGEKSDDYYCNGVSIWFVSNEKECRLVRKDLYGYLADSVEANNCRFVVWEVNAGGSGSKSYIFGCNNGGYFEPSISGKYGNFGKANGAFTATLDSFSEGYHSYETYTFDYNEISHEFTEINSSTGTNTEDNGSSDTDYAADNDYSVTLKGYTRSSYNYTGIPSYVELYSTDDELLGSVDSGNASFWLLPCTIPAGKVPGYIICISTTLEKKLQARFDFTTDIKDSLLNGRDIGYITVYAR